MYFETQFRIFSVFAFLFAPMMLGLTDGDGAGGGAGGDGAAGGGDGAGTAGGTGAGAGGAAGTLLSSTPAAGAAGVGSGAAGAGAGNGNGAAPATGATGASKDPFYVGLWDNTGKINKTAFDRLPDNLKQHKDLFAKYDTAEAFFHGVGNLGQLAGKKGLQPLPEGAPPEIVAERNALLRQINGTPEKPEGYGVKKPDGVPDEQWNGEYVTGMVGILHKHNASPALVKELMKADSEFAAKMREGFEGQSAAAIAQETTALKTAFGEGDTYAAKINSAQRAARTLGLDINDPSIGNNSKIIIALSKVAEMVSEDRLVSGDGKGGEAQTDRQKAQSIVNDPSNPLHKPYHDANDPRHEEAVQAHSTFNKRWHATKKK